MSSAQRVRARYWLLPHERWVVRWAERVRARRVAQLPGPRRLAVQQNYGPDGDVLIVAALADLEIGGFLGIGGVVVANLAGGQEILSGIGDWLAVAGILSAMIVFPRLIQLSRAGKAFRAGRPLIRPEQRR